MGDHAPSRREDLSSPASIVAADAAALEAGRRLFAQSCHLMTSAAALDTIPAGGIPEVAFAGRSNVGKSSLINALTGRASLARTSNTPGRTQQLNFFSLDGRLMLADLPGYGYARAPRSDVERWTALVQAYLRGRASLRRTLLLIDCRHGLKESDRRIMGMLDRAGVAYQAILTKTDKSTPGDLQSVVTTVAEELVKHAAAHPVVLATSAERGSGIAELRAVLAALALPAAHPSPDAD